MIDAHRLREILDYDALTGELRYRKGRAGKPPGSLAGFVDRQGYVQVKLDRKHYLAHRLAWLFVHGEWPKDLIDHINHNRADNRIANLRVVSNAENQRHRKGAQRNSKTGMIGVCWDACERRYKVQVQVDGRRVARSFDSIIEAEKAAKALRSELHTWRFA